MTPSEPGGRRSPRRVLCVVAATLLSLCPPATATPVDELPPLDPHAEQPGTGLGGSVDRWVPPPAMFGPSAEGSTSGSDSLAAVQRAFLPSPTGDAFLDVDPPGLAEAAPGQVLAVRDVTAVGGPLVGAPAARVTQFVVRSADAAGAPSRATATLVEPATPWTGPGARPLLVNATPIDALGTRCSPAYTFAHGFGDYSNFMDFVPPTTALATARGYAVLLPDHEGPTMAYSDPLTAGHAILDTVRGARALAPDEAGGRIAVTGYSGGAIAAVGTGKLLREYAPELVDDVAGIAAGGVPADVRILLRSMSGNAAVGLLTAAVFGMARQHLEVVELANNLALQLGTSGFRDQCALALAAHGATLAPIQALTRDDGALGSPPALRLYDQVLLADRPVPVPMYVYQGAQEFWLPTQGTRELVAQQCALGAAVEYHEVLGEHGIAAVTGYPDVMSWLDARLQGVPARPGC